MAAEPLGAPLLRPAIGTLVFVILVPGTVVGWIPYAITGWQLERPLLGASRTQWLGVALFVPALAIFLDFAVRFVWEGRGTPRPGRPYEVLVRGGTYRYYTRNPGYLGVLGMLLGQALLFGSGWLLVYAAAVGVSFHSFVVLYEEPTLRRQFGEEYEAYCRRVPRWIPRRQATRR